MKLSDMKEEQSYYTQLGSRVLAVLHRRVDGWCVYIDAVPGYSHAEEWPAVLHEGAKAKQDVAEAIAKTYFYPGFTIDLPYAH